MTARPARICTVVPRERRSRELLRQPAHQHVDDRLIGLAVRHQLDRRQLRVGLDVVPDIEEHYAQVRPGLPEGPRAVLRKYIDEGWLGIKSGRGFYDYSN